MVSCAAIAGPKLAAKSVKSTASQGAMPRYGMAVYSDLCIHRESGEFGGRRVTVQRFAEVDTVIYEYTAGGLSWPLVAEDVQIGPRGDKMIFSVQLEGEEKTFSGTFADNGNTFVLDGGHCGQADAPARLAKVTDFGRNPPPCKPCPAAKAPPHAPHDAAPAGPDAPSDTLPATPAAPAPARHPAPERDGRTA